MVIARLILTECSLQLIKSLASLLNYTSFYEIFHLRFLEDIESILFCYLTNMFETDQLFIRNAGRPRCNMVTLIKNELNWHNQKN